MSTSEKPRLRLKFNEQHASEATLPLKPPLSVGTELLHAACGHAISFDLYAKDPHREGRRVKALSRACPACRQARAQAEVTAAADRRAIRKKGPPPSGFKPRLPDGARFTATYDAIAVRWPDCSRSTARRTTRPPRASVASCTSSTTSTGRRSRRRSLRRRSPCPRDHVRRARVLPPVAPAAARAGRGMCGARLGRVGQRAPLP